MVATPIKSLSITWESLPTDYVLPDNPVENIQQLGIDPLLLP